MRMLSVLIVGILGSTVTNGITSVQSAKVPSYVRLLGYVNTTIEDIEKFDRELCETNGGAGTHQAHKNDSKQFDVCVDTLKDKLHEEAMAAQRHNVTNALYKSFCGRIPDIENCLKNFTNSMKTCLDVEKHESADIVYNIFSRVSRFLCEDGGTHWRKISTSSSLGCMWSSAQPVINCANRTIVKYVQTTISTGAQLGGLGKLHLLVPDFNKCSIFEEFQNCAMAVLKNCSSLTISRIADSVLDIVKEVANCDYLLNPGTSTATVVIASLLSVLIVISLLYFSVNYLRRKKLSRFEHDIRLSEAYDDE